MAYIGYEQVPVAGVVVGFASFTLPAGCATHMELQAETANIRYTMDGTIPDATTGMLLINGSDPVAFLIENLLTARFFGDGGAAAMLHVHYFTGRSVP